MRKVKGKRKSRRGKHGFRAKLEGATTKLEDWQLDVLLGELEGVLDKTKGGPRGR